MASLKEVKNRIVSVGSMKKITTARQMIASAQLYRAQELRERAAAYKDALGQLAASLLTNTDEIESPFIRQQSGGQVAIVIMSSNTGMCGSFNANMVKELQSLHTTWPKETCLLFPIGKKIREAAERAGYHTGYDSGQTADQLAGKASYEELAGISNRLLELYRTQQVKQVELIYYQYKNRAIQEIVRTPLLPYQIPPPPEETGEEQQDFIFEPEKNSLIEKLIPMLVRANLYYALTENQTSEHAARSIAMQLATENADKLLTELQLTKNKLRQQNITSELLDIIGGSFA